MRPCPSIPHLAHRLRTLALTSPPETALFYARLWHAVSPPTPDDHECLHVLALCHIQAGSPYTAIGYVRDLVEPISDFADHRLTLGTRSSQGCMACALIVAKCCDALGRFSEGKEVIERALKTCSPSYPPTLTPTTTAATAQLLMAGLSRKGKAPQQAAEAYSRALVEDPWLWEAFVGLCDIGAPPPVEKLFPNPPSTRPASHSSRQPSSPNPMPRSSVSEIPGIPSRRQMSPLSNGSSGGLFTPEVNTHAALPRIGMLGVTNSWDTPSTYGDTTFPGITDHSIHPTQPKRPLPNIISAFIPSLPSSFRSSNAQSTPANPEGVQSKPPAMKRARGGHARRVLETPHSGLPHHGRDLQSIEPNGEEGAPVRRSSRLKTTGSKPITKSTREKLPTRSRSGTSISSASGATAEAHSPSSSDPSLQGATDDWIRDVVRRCARAYRSLSMYACQDAIDELKAFPMDTIRFNWCLEIAARAHYEKANYPEACRVFKQFIKGEPYTLRSMDCYSTLLWHLGEAPALSHLAQRLIAIDRESTQAWIAAGNVFSWQKNHEEAMRCFRRATQVDPACAYAWTLCGYEAIEMEEYDRAMAFYRSAIRADARHYNAWYGMGLVYSKTGKPKHAEHHYRRAAEINPTSPVLLMCIGSVLEEEKELDQALAFYNQACRVAPDSVMAAYRKARVLVEQERLDEAISLLAPMSRTAPDEAQIQFLLAKCYLQKGMRVEATLCFTSARELNPKLEGAIKTAMGGDEEGTDDEEE
ncbi:hypothetical protein DB88DRAFT_540332 [Papiliotrema laurentii]|uniref:Uncharacterized protein n=1 Tax=Papiliotrema laurentii TaxID=5418 RepID=A0AAD9FQQ5_PAPLA|nr:hypothetical protein DB88DRAFT_540332 [Papiliotrema laurentii]